MLSANILSRSRISRIIIYAIVATTILFLCAAGSNVAVLSFSDPGSRTAAIPVTCTIPPSGLVSWWTGDGHSRDTRGTNHGSLQNSPIYLPGQVDSAFNFNGVNQYLYLPQTADLPVRGTNDFTIEAWINHDSAAGYEMFNVFAYRNGGQDVQFFITPTQIGIWGTSVAGMIILTNHGVNAATWNHYAFTRSGSTWRVYVNGNQVGGDGTSAVSLLTPTTPQNIGTTGLANTQFARGSIDEIGIYDRGLAQTEIQAIYNSGTAGKCRQCTVAPVGLVSWWSADGNALDQRSRNNGAMENGATYTNGKVGQGFELGGTGQRVLVGNPADLHLQNFTIETWIKRSSATILTNNPVPGSEGGSFFAYGQGGYAIGMREATNTVFLTEVGLSYVESPTMPITDTNFHHVAVTKTGNQVVFYVDGNASPPITYNVNFAFNTNAAIGARGDGSILNSFFGVVDDLSIYNRALTAAEVGSIVNGSGAGKCKPTAATPPNGMVAWWGGDGNAGDNSGTGNQGNLIDTAGFGIGKVGQAFSLDGVNDYVEVPHSTSINFGANQPMSFDVWLKRTGTNTYQPIFTKRADCFVELHYYFAFYEGDNTLLFGSTGAPANGVSTTADKLPLDTWTHVSVSFDGTNATMYVNGDAVATHAMTLNPNTAPLAIGGQPTCGQYFGGLIDELTFYNRAITPAEISGIYNAGLAGKLRSVVTPANTFAEPRNMKLERTLDIPGIQLGDATVTLPIVSTGGVTQQIPLDPAKLPPLPMGATPTALTYDIATSAIWSGTPSVCFNLPALSSVYRNLRILHLENGVWVNRTQVPGVNPILCTYGLTSLSPFTIADFGPTAAHVSISGRVMTKSGNGVLNAIVQLTDQQGTTRTVRTSAFGYYRFDDVPVGENYVIGVASKRFTFTPRAITVTDELDNVDLVAEPEMLE